MGTAHPQSALIVAHGQPSAPAPPEATLRGLADQVAADLPGWQMLSATLAMPGAIESALQACATPPLVYPMFMADGFFVQKQLPKRLGDFGGRILPPLGLDPSLPEIAAQAVTTEADRRGWDAARLNLLLAAHGSARGPRAAQSANAFADNLRPLLPGASITTGFVEEDPRIATAARGLGDTALCLPFFALGGDHVTGDIPEGLTEAGFTGDTLPPLGLLPAIPALVARALRADTHA